MAEWSSGELLSHKMRKILTKELKSTILELWKLTKIHTVNWQVPIQEKLLNLNRIAICVAF